MSNYEYMSSRSNNSITNIICNVCREIKDERVTNLLCKHYICPSCYVSLKMQKKENCVTCDRVMIRHSGCRIVS